MVRDFQALPVMNFWRPIQAEHYKELRQCFQALKLPATPEVSWKDFKEVVGSRYFGGEKGARALCS